MYSRKVHAQPVRPQRAPGHHQRRHPPAFDNGLEEVLVGGYLLGSGDDGYDPRDDASAGGGGDCTAPPTCEGDPIACAVLQQTWQNRCVDEIADGDLESEFGSDDFESEIADRSDEQDMESLDSTGWISASCMADMTVDVMGTTLTFPLSDLCFFFELLSFFIMAAAAVSSARIISGGL